MGGGKARSANARCPAPTQVGGVCGLVSARALSLFPSVADPSGGCVCDWESARARTEASRQPLFSSSGGGRRGERGGGWGSMTFELKKQDYRFSFMVWFFNAGFFFCFLTHLYISVDRNTLGKR